MKLFILLTSIAFISSSPLSSTSSSDQNENYLVKNNYKYVEDLKKYFKIHKIPLSWGDAAMTCMAEGGHLYVPNSIEELNTLQENNLLGTWIGIHDKYAEGVFYTIKGEMLMDTYSNWAKDEPNDKTKDEDCVSLKSDKSYQDIGCLNKHTFTCQYEKKYTYDDICDTYDKYIYNANLNKCYKLHNIAMTWHQAVRICKGENSKLAFINDEREANNLKQIIAQSGYTNISIHMGYSDLMIQGVAMNLEGMKVSDTNYNKWVSNQLENYQRCGSANQDALFDKIDCLKRLIFVCEKSVTDVKISETVTESSSNGDTNNTSDSA